MSVERITWPSFWDGGSVDGPIAKAWHVIGWPTVYVLDAGGVIRYRSIGGKPAEIESIVAKLLAEITPQ